mgnify:CR=1 FL=1
MRIQPCNGLARRESFSKRQICPDLKEYMIHGERKPMPLYPIPFSFSRARTT